jgi:hypothetical protein
MIKDLAEMDEKELAYFRDCAEQMVRETLARVGSVVYLPEWAQAPLDSFNQLQAELDSLWTPE